MQSLFIRKGSLRIKYNYNFFYFKIKFNEKLTFSFNQLFLFGALLSIYHFGIEQGIFEESFVCSHQII